MTHPDFETRRRILRTLTFGAAAIGSGLVDPVGVLAQSSTEDVRMLSNPNIHSIVLAHGRGGSSREPMMLELQSLLQLAGYRVINDDLGSDFNPSLKEWRYNFAKAVDKAEGETMLVGWSLGARICLDYINNFSNTSVKKGVLIASRELNPQNTPLPEFYLPYIDPSRVIEGFPQGRAVVYSNNDKTLRPDATPQLSETDPGPVLVRQILALPKFIADRGHFGSVQDARDIDQFLRKSVLI